jgi:hypothetical protein
MALTSDGAIRFPLVIGLMLAGFTGCNNGQNQPVELTSGDPGSGNLAPTGQPADQGYSPEQYYQQNYYPPSEGSETYEQPVEASEPPPPLPEYSQPPCPGDNYMWTPGYWSYASAGYYWVPGAWVMAPWVGALWTPPWWGYSNGAYLWHAGFWGSHIGFYGGINYGFGYTGRGYYGAYWNNGAVYYNRTVTNVNVTIVRNVYNYSVTNNYVRVSYNGGRGGIEARPTPQELAVTRDPRMAAVPAQVQYARQASADRAQFVAAGAAWPAALALARPLSTSYKAPASRPPAAALRAARPTPEPRAQVQPNERPGAPAARPEIPENRAVPQPLARPEVRPVPETRPSAPEGRPGVEAPAPRQQPENRPAPAAHPSAPERGRPETPIPARPEIRPEQRPQAPAPARPEPRPESRSSAAPRPEPQARPEARPTPQARPEPQPRPEPQARPEARPAPRPAPKEERKEPEGR